MLGILGGDERCPIARSLDVLGEKWTLMIVRDALLGARRFSEFHSSLGLPKEVLSTRLNSLVEAGVLCRSPYKPEGGRLREEYLLTEAGHDLSLVLLVLGDWADRHRPAIRTSDLRFTEADSGEIVTAVAVTSSTGRLVSSDQIHMLRGDDVKRVEGL
jgi:DNA-binding HxlR family transcriptional regulator